MIYKKRINMIMRKRFMTAVAVVFMGCIATMAQTPVEKHGQLTVNKTHLTDCHGQPVQLRGVSMGWHNLWPRFYNRSTVATLAKDWKVDIVRCSIGVSLDSLCYDKNPELAYNCVDSIVQGAVENGVYVLVDFHSHPNNLELAKTFFNHVTKKYGKLPNLLLEIWNEPMEVEWAETKAYAEKLIPLIRKKAPKAVVIVPTPRWDQEVDKAADDPIKGIDNIMYSLHYYAATHKQYLRDKAQYALDKGLPLFMAECAGMMHTGDGVIDPNEWQAWMDFADKNSISWCAWSLSDKVETCSMLTPGAPTFGKDWKQQHLKPWAVLVRHYLTTGR